MYVDVGGPLKLVEGKSAVPVRVGGVEDRIALVHRGLAHRVNVPARLTLDGQSEFLDLKTAIAVRVQPLEERAHHIRVDRVISVAVRVELRLASALPASGVSRRAVMPLLVVVVRVGHGRDDRRLKRRRAGHRDGQGGDHEQVGAPHAA